MAMARILGIDFQDSQASSRVPSLCVFFTHVLACAVLRTYVPSMWWLGTASPVFSDRHACSSASSFLLLFFQF